MGYSPQSDLSGEQWLMLVLALTLTLGLWLTTTSAPAQTAPADTVAQIKAAFDQAMAKPLAERIPDLEALEQRIASNLFEGIADPNDRRTLLEILYRVQVGIARYPQSRATFSEYSRSLKNWAERERARTALLEWIAQIGRLREHAECVELVNIALEHWSDDENTAAALLYTKADHLVKLNGREVEALPVLNTIIQHHPNSPWRPRAMRILAGLQASGIQDGGGTQAALATLELMEQQYQGTRWEQFAHMAPALIFEVRQGNPQQALNRFVATLDKFPDHWFATFCRANIERLQQVVEEQLIKDALEGLGRNQQRDFDPEGARLGEAAALDQSVDLGQTQ